MQTFFQDDAIVRRTSSDLNAVFSSTAKKFMIRQRPPVTTMLLTLNDEGKYSLPIQSTGVSEDVLVRLPALRESKGKFLALQRWTGRVERVGTNTFVAVLTDDIDSSNPIEEVEIDICEVSSSDRSLLVDGATFYWTIGYRDSTGGQRDRMSSIRFARQPALSNSAVARAFKEADLIAAQFEA
jgi:hypothetical protein